MMPFQFLKKKDPVLGETQAEAQDREEKIKQLLKTKLYRRVFSTKEGRLCLANLLEDHGLFDRAETQEAMVLKEAGWRLVRDVFPLNGLEFVQSLFREDIILPDTGEENG
jgi:hypothetical protein